MLVRAARRATPKHVRLSGTCTTARRCLQNARTYIAVDNALPTTSSHPVAPPSSSAPTTKSDRRDLSTSAQTRQEARTTLHGPPGSNYLPFMPKRRSPPPYVRDKFGTATDKTEKRDALVILGIPELALSEKKKESRKEDPLNLGFTGSRNELLATFVACAKGGQLARAEMMLERLTSLSAEESPQSENPLGTFDDINIIQAHNLFLEALLKEAASLEDETAQTKASAKIADWYNNSIVDRLRSSGNTHTFAILFQSAFYDKSLKSQRKLREYLKMWRDSNLGLLGDVFAEPILEERAIVKIIQACNIKEEELYPDQQALLENNRLADDPKSHVPDVLSASRIKGFGLKAVQESLRSFTEPDFMPTSIGFETEEENYAFAEQRQKLLEYDAYESAVKRWRSEHEALKETGTSSSPSNPLLKSNLWEWHQAMQPLIEEELQRVAEAEARPGRSNIERCQYGPYLRVLSPEKLAVITIMTIIRLATVGTVAEGMKTSRGVLAVGRAIEHESLAEEVRKREAHADVTGKSLRRPKVPELKTEKDVVIYMNRIKHQVDKGQHDLLAGRWSESTLAKVGSVLTSMLIHAAVLEVKVPQFKVARHMKTEDVYAKQPAFYHTYQYVFGKRLGVIKVHGQLIKMLGSEPLQGSLISKQLPMLVKPRPWSDWNDGAYYFTPSRVMRARGSVEQTAYVKEASARGDLNDFFRGLDVLGSTSWRINQRVFKVILEVWNSGEKFADIPAELTDDDDFITEPPKHKDLAARAAWLAKMKEVSTERQNAHSQRCDVNFKMEIARAFYHEKFYFPHNVDFRGRAYPIPPHLNHIGNDLCRGVMKFGESKPLGKNGLRWLKIHLANLCGFDKASLSDREQYTMNHLEDVCDSARNPLTGNRWWLKSEDPWQCLAACMEVEAALSSEDPEAFETNLAVHQDGTCNGLQHYAALGGDEAGAKEVNLAPSDKPQDVYTGVAELVKEAVLKDIEAGEEMAKKVFPHITRKVVKQTVMTNVYGVTFIGARIQVSNRLKEIEEIAKDDVRALSYYLTKKIFASLRTMFTGAHDIQTWLGECARRITRSVGPSQFLGLKAHSDNSIPTTNKKKNLKERGKAEFMSSVIWTTPLKLPVVQPYRHEASVIIKTNLQNISITDPNIINEVNSRKQMSAFPPNFIHSLDASHMLLCALECQKAGLAFAAVHDSFWTHPCDVDQMNGILRDAFVKLHSQDIIARLKDEFETRYAGYKTIMSIPASERLAKDILQLRKKLNSERQVGAQGRLKGMTAVEDLERELLRDRLLASDIPEERAKGEAMITPGSLVETYGLSINDDFDKVVSTGFAETGEEAKDASAAGPIRTEQHMFEIAEVGAMEEMHSVGEKGKASATIITEEPDVSDEMIENEPNDTAKTSATSPVEDLKKMDVKGKRGAHFVLVWVDLKFPNVPAKGNFDVSRLKESQYFFS